MAVTQEQALEILKERGITIAPTQSAQQDAGTIIGQELERRLPTFAVRGIQRAAPTLQAIAQSAPIQGILGAGDIIRRNIGAVLPSAIRPQFVPEGDPRRLAYQVGGGIGDIASFLGASELGGAALGGARGLPLLSRAAQTLGGGAGRILGTGLYGAATTPENRLRGALTGTVAGTVGEAIPGIAALAKYASPQRLTDSIMNYLRGGRSVEENAKSLASDIKNLFETKKGEASDLYSPLFDSVGDSSIYGDLVTPTKLGKQIDPSLAGLLKKPDVNISQIDGNIVNLPQIYKNLDPEITNSYLPDIRKLHNKFIDNPTVQNAHDLQSQLGFEIRKLENQPVKSIADTRDMQNWRTARDSLKQDVNSFLNIKDNSGDLTKMYGDATNFYRDNVAPYLSNSGIAKIAKGNITNPKNIPILFKFPSEDITKIASDIGDEGKKKILYSELGKKIKMTPEDLTSEISKLEPKGLSSYITPNLQMQLDKIPARITAKTALQRGAGLAAGLALIPHAAGEMPEILGGIGSAAVTPAIMRTLQRNLPIAPMARGIGRAYPAIRRGALGLGVGQPLPSGVPQPSGITPAQARQILKERGIQ